PSFRWRRAIHSFRNGILAFVAALVLANWCASPSLAQVDPADALINKALELVEAGKYAEPLPLAERALMIQERTLSVDDPDLVITQSILGSLYYQLGRYAQSESVLKKALARAERTLDPDHLFVSAVQISLAKLYRAEGRYGGAEPLYKRSLEINEKNFG